MVKRPDYAQYTRNEFCDVIEDFVRQISELNKYVAKLESVIRVYKSKDTKGELSAMIKENLASKTLLEEKDSKISQLVEELLDSSIEVESLEAEIKRMKLTIMQYESMITPKNIEIKQIKN